MKLELEKRVTEITYNERDSTAAVYTHNAYMRTRLEKLACDRPRVGESAALSLKNGYGYILERAGLSSYPKRTDRQRPTG